MAKDTQKSFPIDKAYAFAKKQGLEEQANKIHDFEFESLPPARELMIRKGRLIRLFEDNSIYTKFITECWPYGSTPDGQARHERCVRFADAYGDTEGDEEADIDDDTLSAAFAIEAHLRAFLAKGNNLNQVESGLKIYKQGDKSGVEYPIDDGNGRIDILAVDSSGGFVVIELKLGKGRNRALGQLLYYMGWVDLSLGNKAGPCRGLIIANDIPDQLKIAVSQTPRVKLARYQMTFSIEHVEAALPTIATS